MEEQRNNRSAGLTSNFRKTAKILCKHTEENEELHIHQYQFVKKKLNQTELIYSYKNVTNFVDR